MESSDSEEHGVKPVLLRGLKGFFGLRADVRKILIFAAVVEVSTGLVLLADPSIVVTLLLGMDVSGVGTPLGRCFGIALLALGLACWPSRQRAESGSPAFRAMLSHNGGVGARWAAGRRQLVLRSLGSSQGGTT
jgi:hypothetical protein